MSDPAPTAWLPWIGQLVLAGFLGLFTWMGRRTVERHVARVDAHQVRLESIERTYVSREELQRYMESMRGERREMHNQNLETIGQLRGSVDTVNANIIRILTERR